MTILLIEHHMDMVARLCDHVIVLAEGRRLAEGSFADVAADPAVQEAYMGRRRSGLAEMSLLVATGVVAGYMARRMRS